MRSLSALGATLQTEIQIFSSLYREESAPLKEVQRFLSSYSFELQSLREDIGKFRNELTLTQERAAEIEAVSIQELTRERDASCRELGNEVEFLLKKMIDKMQAYNRQISVALAALRVEAKAIGHTI